jgi:hypothetical protein
MKLHPEEPKRYEIDLTTMELSMLTQALILMMPQVEQTLNAATGEIVTTLSLVHKLLHAGMTANARADVEQDLPPPLTAREWIGLAQGDIVQHVVSGEAYAVVAPAQEGRLPLVRSLTAMNPAEWRRVPMFPEDREVFPPDGEDADG